MAEKIGKKWDDYINWKEYFMSVAVLASKRSKDPDFRVGACIVNDKNQIVGIGYNGMPMLRGDKKNDEMFSWLKEGDLKNKHLYVCHAELNAIAHKTSMDVKDCTMYVTLAPCNECAKIITQSRIKKVVYLSDEKGHKLEFIAGRKILEAAEIYVKQYDITKRKIVIDFDEILNQAKKISL